MMKDLENDFSGFLTKRKRRPYSCDWDLRFNFFATVIAKSIKPYLL